MDKKHSTKERIIDCAIDLFSRKGYTETSVREIARAVGIKESSIYNHFSSKQNILKHILDIYEEFTKSGGFEAFDIEEFKSSSLPVEERIMDCLVSFFPKEKEEMYLKSLFIIFHEQYRNELVKQFMVETFIKRNLQYIKGIVDKLVEEEIIEPVDSDAVAKMNVAINCFFSSANLLGLIEGTPSFPGSGMFDLKRILYRTFLKLK